MKTIVRPDGRRRVLIVQRCDDHFQYIEETRRDISLDVPFNGPRERWAPLPTFATICDTAATAEREAHAEVDWLIAQDRDSDGGGHTI